MKKNIFFGLVIFLVILAVSSCSIFGVGTSMSDRIGSFVDDLNGTRANIFDNIHPDANATRTLDDSYWNIVNSTWDPTFKTFSITNKSEGSSSVTGTFTSGDYLSGTGISFEMKDDGDFFSGENWKIWSCSVNGTSQF